MASARPIRHARVSLSRDAIVRATMELLEEQGVAGISMRAVAGRLGCEAMSLYRHVPNKAGLLELVGAAVVREIQVPDQETMNWDDCLRGLLRELRRVALQHPAAFELVARRPLTSMGLGPLESGMRTLARAGLDPDDAARVLCTLLAFAAGAIGNELAARRIGGPLAGGSDSDHSERTDAPHAYHFMNVMQDTSYEAEFEFGLDMLIRGLPIQRSC
jgi:AcrR family transcriptional regulator